MMLSGKKPAQESAVTPALEVRDLTFTYPGGAAPVLDRASLVVPDGAFALLTGATGSGKSTLLRLVKPEIAPAGERAGVKTQREVLPFGGTDASAIQLSRGGVIAGTVSIPCRYVHSACEVIDLRDVEAARGLLLEYLK